MKFGDHLWVLNRAHSGAELEIVSNFLRCYALPVALLERYYLSRLGPKRKMEQANFTFCIHKSSIFRLRFPFRAPMGEIVSFGRCKSLFYALLDLKVFWNDQSIFSLTIYYYDAIVAFFLTEQICLFCPQSANTLRKKYMHVKMKTSPFA